MLELDLSGNPMSQAAVLEMYSWMTSELPPLRQLKLSHCKLTDPSMDVLADALADIADLFELDLSQNAVSCWV